MACLVTRVNAVNEDDGDMASVLSVTHCEKWMNEPSFAMDFTNEATSITEDIFKNPTAPINIATTKGLTQHYPLGLT